MILTSSFHEFEALNVALKLVYLEKLRHATDFVPGGHNLWQ